MKTRSVFKILSALLFIAVLSACGQKAKTDAKVTNAETDPSQEVVLDGKKYVEVLVFHGVKQCETCLAIKKHTQEIVDEKFAARTASHPVIFRIVDFSKPENTGLADKYEIAWTSVVLVKHDADGKEQVNNIGRFAIENALDNTDLYRRKLEEEINKLLI